MQAHVHDATLPHNTSQVRQCRRTTLDGQKFCPTAPVNTGGQFASQARKAREATIQRDLIRQMREEGAPLRTIAEAAGLTHTAVAKILARPVAAEPHIAQRAE